jgi:Flp pilus assembly protein TadG
VPNSKPLPSRGRSARGRGQALTEFALVIPIFLLVLSGILDFGFMLYSRMTVINAAREGARAAVIADKDTRVVVAQQRAKSAASGAGLALDVSQVAVTCVRPLPPPGSACDFADTKPGDSVSVTVNYTYTPFFPLRFGLVIPLTSTVQMVLE